MNTYTLDRPAPGVVIAQPRRGFRYGCEAFWLVGFALEEPLPARALDVGTGSGIAAMLLAARGVHARGVDVRPEWTPFWRLTDAHSDVRAAWEVVDVRDLAPGAWPLVVSNPPFFAAGSGPEPADPWVRAARFEDQRGFAPLIAAVCAQVSPGGRAVVVVPADRAAAVEAASGAVGFAVRRRLWVGRRRVLIELKNGASLVEDTALAEDDPRVAGWYAAVGAVRGGAGGATGGRRGDDGATAL